MANNISGVGLRVSLIASVTFPLGITITQFADDTDPFDSASVSIGDATTGLNGDLIKYGKATPIPAVLAVIPRSDDDINLGILLEANRVGKNKISAQDDITMIVSYPDGGTVTATGGGITDGVLMTSVASAGRFKSKTYGFKFENKIEA